MNISGELKLTVLKIIKEFGLPLNRIEIVPFRNQKYRGVCTLGGTILLVNTKWDLKTLAHELAHLRILNHNKWHEKLTEKIFKYFAH